MIASPKTPHGGFTLIELVVVIVILGILAAFAVPRFANIARDTRISALTGLAESLRSTSALVHGMAMAQQTNPATVTLEGQTINLVFGYPAATAPASGGIVDTLNTFDTTTYTATATTGPNVLTITVNSASGTTPAGCNVVYAEPTAAGLPATITVSPGVHTDC